MKTLLLKSLLVFVLIITIGFTFTACGAKCDDSKITDPMILKVKNGRSPRLKFCKEATFGEAFQLMADKCVEYRIFPLPDDDSRKKEGCTNVVAFMTIEGKESNFSFIVCKDDDTPFLEKGTLMGKFNPHYVLEDDLDAYYRKCKKNK